MEWLNFFGLHFHLSRLAPYSIIQTAASSVNTKQITGLRFCYSYFICQKWRLSPAMWQGSRRDWLLSEWFFIQKAIKCIVKDTVIPTFLTDSATSNWICTTMMQAKYDFAPYSKQQSGVHGSWSIYEAALVGTFLSHQKNQGTNDGKSNSSYWVIIHFIQFAH